MKYLIFLVFFFVFMSSSYAKDTIPLGNDTLYLPRKTAFSLPKNAVSSPKGDTVYLSLKNSKYSENKQTLTIFLPQKYKKRFKKMRVEVDIKTKEEVNKRTSKKSISISTLDYPRPKITKADKKSTIIKFNLATMLNRYFEKREAPYKKVEKNHIEKILNHGFGWRLVKR